MTAEENAKTACSVGNATYRTITTKQFWFIIFSLLFAMITAGLQAEIIGDAATTIAQKFDAEIKMGWMASSGFLVQACTLLIYGKLYDLLEPKKILLTSLVFFSAGSFMSGGAKSFTILIIGQALAGLGRAGIVVGCVIILGIVTTSRMQRAFFVSVVSAGYGIMLKVAPLVAGLLLKKESKEQWRWIFWIAIPDSLLLIVLVSFFPKLRRRRSTWAQFGQFDFVGAFLQAGGLVLFVIPLLIGTSHGSFKWSSPTLISLYILTPISLCLFIWWESRQPEEARYIPLDAIRENRSISLLAITTFVSSLIVSCTTFWLPTYLQFVRGSSPIVSALQLLPAVLIGSIASVVVGKCLSLGGSRTHQIICIFGSSLQIGGAIAFWFFRYDMPYAQFYLDSIITSVGVGCTFAIGITLVLDLVPEHLFGQVSSFMQIASALGALFGVAIQGVIVTGSIESFLVPYGGVSALQTFKQLGGMNTSSDSLLQRRTDTLLDTAASAIEAKIAYHNTQRNASLLYAAAGILSLIASLALSRHVSFVDSGILEEQVSQSYSAAPSAVPRVLQDSPAKHAYGSDEEKGSAIQANDIDVRKPLPLAPSHRTSKEKLLVRSSTVSDQIISNHAPCVDGLSPVRPKSLEMPSSANFLRADGIPSKPGMI